ncbi:D-mannonate oxidoreductase [Salmonella enterica subsp. enterica serovar Typhimurium]|nr:D-mannonate oxidoreductase [Salmonella enterica subsp. enterica serovar Typhimurium]
MQNRLLSAKATLPDYDRAALAARMVHLVLARFIARIRGFTQIFWLRSSIATGAIMRLILLAANSRLPI